MNQKLRSLNKLKSTSQIHLLFKIGIWLVEKDLKLVYQILGDSKINFDFRCGVSISKKSFKKAVERNKIKRLLRECIRLNQNPLLDLPKNLIFMLIYSTTRTNTTKKFQELQDQYLKIIDKVKLENNPLRK